MDKKRQQWDSKAEFMLTTISYSVGIGNIMRFPYICMQNGGGAFLLPYIFFLFLCGAPLFLAEVSLGQFTNLGVVGVWDFAPAFRGLGWCMISISGFICIYYVVLISWVLYYLGMSFRLELPWARCGNTWNTPTCFSYSEMIENNITVFSDYLRTKNATIDIPLNSTIRWRSAAEEFYLYNVLNITSNIEEIGGMNWHIFICFIVGWFLSYLGVINSTKSMGKIVYVTATLPYFLLTVFIIRGSLLQGSLEGVKFYIIPKWKTLLTPKVWITAAGQIFYSLGPGWGGLIVMSSYNQFRSDVVKRAVILPIICCATSVYGGFAIFSVVGYMAHVANITDIRNVIDSGFGLAFVAYPQAMALMPGGYVWSVLFFLNLLTLGIGSMFSTYETFLQGIRDEFPVLRGARKHFFTVGLTVILMFFGLPFTTRAGAYIYQVIDWYSTPIAVIIIAMVETLAMTWFYNYKRMLEHMTLMRNKTISKGARYWFICCFMVCTPLSLLAIFIGLCVDLEEPVFNGVTKYPPWVIAMSWCFAVALVLPIPINLIYQIVKAGPNWRSVFYQTSSFKSLEYERIMNQNVDQSIEKEQLTSL